MAHKLADETLAAILDDSLAVSDEDFAFTRPGASPFARIEVTSSALLLVCKRWLRVATPLLYHTVVLRSVAQARALAAALKKNPAFGKFIRKVRIEGGYGASVPNVLRAAPNLTDLCVSLHLSAGENALPMFDAMQTATAPTRLIVINLRTTFRRSNKQVASGLRSIESCIRSWTSLRVLVLNDSFFEDEEDMYSAVCSARNLEVIHFPQRECNAYNAVQFLNKLARDAVAPIIRVGWTKSSARDDSTTEFSPLALSKVQFATSKRDALTACLKHVEESANPLYIPFAGVADDIRRKIWTKIFIHTIDPSQAQVSDHKSVSSRALSALLGNGHRRSIGQIVSCMLVCREWKELMAPVACRNLTLRNARSVHSWEALVAMKPELPSLTSRLALKVDLYRAPQSESDRQLAQIMTLLPAFTNLQVLDTGRLQLTADAVRALPITLRDLVVSSGAETYLLPSLPSLKNLEWYTDDALGFTVMQGVNAPFPALEQLTMTGGKTLHLLEVLTRYGIPRLHTLDICSCKFDTLDGLDDPPPASAFSTATLPALRKLILDNNDLLEPLAQMSIPCLEVFEFSGCKAEELISFFTACGSNIQQIKQRRLVIETEDHYVDLILDECPAVTSIDISNCNFPPRPLAPRPQHPTLRRIVSPILYSICVSTFARSYYSKMAGRTGSHAQNHVSNWAKFARSVPDGITLRMPQDDLWPDTSKSATQARHPIPPIAEELLQRGVRVVDRHGIGWKPRLTSTKRKSR